MNIISYVFKMDSIERIIVFIVFYSLFSLNHSFLAQQDIHAMKHILNLYSISMIITAIIILK